jgi:hypothetical protein
MGIRMFLSKSKILVSPGKQNEDRDDRYKRSQDQVRGIPEDWGVDPIQPQVIVLTLVAGL